MAEEVMQPSLDSVPWRMRAHMEALPSQNVGTLYAKLREPGVTFGEWHKVPAWGQLCDGQPHKSFVACMLHNHFPLRGHGWTYLEWKAVPDNPDACKSVLRGKVEGPNTFTGDMSGFREKAWK